MPNVKISDLTAAAAAAGANELEINEAGTSKKITVTQLNTFHKANITAADTGALAISQNLNDVANKTTSRANLGVAIGVDVQAFSANNAFTNVAQTYSAGQRGTVTTLTDAATIATNLALSNNFTVTLAGNRTLGNPTNQVAGQAGSIFIVQDATGNRTLSYQSDWKFAGGTAPTLSTAANAVDRIDYIVRSANNIHAILTKDVK